MVYIDWLIIHGEFKMKCYLRACLDRVQLLDSIQFLAVIVTLNAGKLELILHRVQLLVLGQFQPIVRIAPLLQVEEIAIAGAGEEHLHLATVTRQCTIVLVNCFQLKK